MVLDMLWVTMHPLLFTDKVHRKVMLIQTLTTHTDPDLNRLTIEATSLHNPHRINQSSCMALPLHPT